MPEERVVSLFYDGVSGCTAHGGWRAPMQTGYLALACRPVYALHEGGAAELAEPDVTNIELMKSVFARPSPSPLPR